MAISRSQATRTAPGLTRAGLVRGGVRAGAVPLASAFGLAACGGQPAGQAPAAPSNQPVTLVLNTDWVGAGPRAMVTEAALKEYKQRFPNVTVQAEPLDGDTADKLTALIVSDSIGDVSLWTHHLVVYFAKRDFFADLGRYLKTYKFSMDDVYFIPEICYYENKLLAVPFQLNLFDWTYNKTLFAQKGVAPPPDTWTFDQMVATAKTLTDPDKNVWGLDWSIGTGNPNLWVTPIRANGGTLLNKTFTKTTLSEPAAVETTQLIVDVVQKHQAAPLRQVQTDKKLSFPAGNMAMAFGVGVGRTLDRQMADQGMEWDFFSSPAWPRTGKKAVQANLQPLIVPGNKKQIDHAVQLAFFMGGEYVQGLIADFGNTAPTFKKLIDSDRYLPATHRRKISLDGNSYRWGMGSNFEQYLPWRRAVEAEFFKGWDGQQSAKATADNATAAGDAALAAAGVKVG
jgi:multiple sugar transport system substrate-binding protein